MEQKQCIFWLWDPRIYSTPTKGDTVFLTFSSYTHFPPAFLDLTYLPDSYSQRHAVMNISWDMVPTGSQSVLLRGREGPAQFVSDCHIILIWLMMWHGHMHTNTADHLLDYCASLSKPQVNLRMNTTSLHSFLLDHKMTLDTSAIEYKLQLFDLPIKDCQFDTLTHRGELRQKIQGTG